MKILPLKKWWFWGDQVSCAAFPRRRHGQLREAFRGADDHHAEVPKMMNSAFKMMNSVLNVTITRRDMSHPRYGAPPLYYASCCDGFQDVFASDMATYLEWGMYVLDAACFVYTCRRLIDLSNDCRYPTAKGVFDNFMTFYMRKKAVVKCEESNEEFCIKSHKNEKFCMKNEEFCIPNDEFVSYRGPEFAQYGRTLTLAAQYATLTGDDDLILKHSTKLVGISDMLLAR